MRHAYRTLPAVVAVRTRQAGADARQTTVTALSRRLAHLDRDETGAQAAEYAMLGGVSAAACGALLSILKNPDFLQRVVEAVVRVLVSVIRSWF